MNKAVLGVIIALVAIGGITAVVITSNKEEPTTNTVSTETPDTTHAGMDAPTDSEETPASTTQPQNTNSVTIQNFAFGPATITVKAGTKVTWTNKDPDRHDITPDKADGVFKQSDLLSKGKSYSVTFTKAGTYTYHCSPHPYMKGTVIVTD